MTGVSKRYYRNPNLPIASLIIIDDRPVSSFVKYTPSVWDVWGSITGPVKSTVSRRLAIVATFLWRCVAQALSRGDGLRHS